MEWVGAEPRKCTAHLWPRICRRSRRSWLRSNLPRPWRFCSRRAGPSPALLSAFGYRPEITLDRKLDTITQLLQLAGPKTLGRSGRFTITGHDDPGKHTYVLTFIPAVSSKYATVEAVHKLKVTK